MVKKILILSIGIILIAVACLLWLNYRSNSSLVDSTTPTASPHQSPLPIHWGATIKAYNLNKPGKDDIIASITKQLDLLKELGATDVRANVESNPPIDDSFVNLAVEKGLTPTLILEPPVSSKIDTRQKAYDYAYNIASKYAGKVKYYQLANEANGATVKPSHGGDQLSDYDDAKYQSFKEFVTGLSLGVKAGDPNAKRIISANWVGVAAIDKLISDNVEFDIIGWNWYSDMGDKMTVTSSGKTLNIPAYLSKYNKELWVVELNVTGGTKDKTAGDQGAFLQKFITNTISDRSATGFFVFPITDQCKLLDQGIGRMGLVEVTTNSDGTCDIGKNKSSFDVYKNIIKNSSSSI